MSAFENSPRRPPAAGPVGSKSWAEWTQQLQAYVAWLNSQLRKKPGTKEVIISLAYLLSTGRCIYGVI